MTAGEPGIEARADAVLDAAGIDHIATPGYRSITRQVAAYGYDDRLVLAVAYAMARLARRRGEAW